MDAVRLSNVSKSYGDHLAVDDLSIVVPEGSLYGFIGPNGSGKTTTIRMILRIIEQNSGEISVFGHTEDRAANDMIGYLPEERGLYKKMTVQRVLTYYANLKGIWGANAKTAIGEWLERFSLQDWRKKKIETLSKGMAQKVQFIATIISRPKLIILDEPFSGLDPVNTEIIRSCILDLKREGSTVIFSTHQMEIAERMCDFVFMIHKGKKVLDGSIASIKNQYGTDTVRLRADDGSEILHGCPHVQQVIDMGSYQEIRVNGDPQELIRYLVGRTRIQQFEITHPSLHDIFIRIAGYNVKESASE